MPFLSLILLTIAAGVGSAYAHRRAFILDAGALWKGNGFLAFMIYVLLAIVPVTLYFYAFHADWFLSYWLDIDASFIGGLVSAMFTAAAGAGGYAAGRYMSRRERLKTCRKVIAGCALVAFVGWLVCFPRVMSVGTFRQYHGEFGLTPFFQSGVFAACALMGVLLFIGLAYTVRRVRELSLGHT